MKTVLAALVVSVAVAAPAVASDAAYVLRGAEKTGSSPVVARSIAVPAPIADAVPARKVRVVLASPYGN